MRTTLTIDDDVAFAIREMQKREPEKSLKSLINEILRRGLNGTTRPKRKTPYVVKSRPMGLRTDLNFDNIEEVLDILEGVHRR